MAYRVIAVFMLAFAFASASVIPTVKVLQGPGSRTSLYGPDGSNVESAAPGGTLITDAAAPGLVAAGPAVLPASPQVVIGGGPVGKIVTSYTLAAAAVVPAVRASAVGVASPAVASGLLRVPLGNFGTVTGL